MSPGRFPGEILGSESGFNRLAAVPGLGRPIFAAASPAVRYALTVECGADYVVADTRQVFDAAASDQHHRVLLKVMALTTDVGGDFYSIGQADPGDLPESRVRLLRSHGAHLDANTPPLRATGSPFRPVSERVLDPVHSRSFSLLTDWLSAFSN